jgi:hypothetical protein
MKKIIQYLSLLSAFATMLLLQACLKDKITSTYTSFEPVYRDKAAVLKDIKSSPSQPLKNTGKLVLYGHYIFLNELNKGVHIIDNSNPVSPKNIAFINIPGNIDLALKNNMLYADIYTDMVTIDVSDPHNAVLKKVTSHVFPERIYSNGNGLMADTTRYITDWIKHETSVESEVNRNRNLVLTGQWMDAAAFSLMSSSGGKSSISGIGGSMARFTVVGDYLYTVSQSSLTTFSIIDPETPIKENELYPGWNIETIYPLNGKLFIGSQTGMFIYDISNPSEPVALSSFSHACFRDPVIANDQYAFVTLRATGQQSPCRFGSPQTNELDIVDISNISFPTLVKIYSMEEPQGESLDGNHLFLCDGKGGLKIYDISDVQNIQLLKVFTDINPFDVIAYDGVAIVVAEEGIFQYDYSDINKVTRISSISSGN